MSRLPTNPLNHPSANFFEAPWCTKTVPSQRLTLPSQSTLTIALQNLSSLHIFPT